MNIRLSLNSFRALYMNNFLVILTAAAAALTWSEGQQDHLFAIQETIRLKDRFHSNYASKEGYSYQVILVAIVLSTINVCLLVCLNIRQTRQRNLQPLPHIRNQQPLPHIRR